MLATDPTQLALILLAGFAGSFHCVGMCGGFACALGRADSGPRARRVLRHLLYNGGRVTTYAFLGALAGLAGAGTLGADGSTLAATAQRLLAGLAGVLMIVMGLQLLGHLQRLHAGTAGLVERTLGGSLRGVLHAPGYAAPLAFGVFNGVLPCPLVYAFVALAAATSDPAHGALVMAAFGLGTFPAMLLTGGVASRLRHRWRLYGVRVAGAFVLALGALTLARGVLPLDGHGVHALAWTLPAIPSSDDTAPRGHRH